MAIDFNLPTLKTLKASFLTYILDNIKAVAKMNFSVASNIPEGAIRWNSTDNKFEKYVSSVWTDLSSEYDIVAALATAAGTLTDLDSTVAELDKAADGIGVTIPRTKVVTIGDWDMDADQYVYIAAASHGVTGTVVGVQAFVRNDADAYHLPLDTEGDGYASWNHTVFVNRIILRRITSGQFDSTDYNATSFDRGYVIINYID